MPRRIPILEAFTKRTLIASIAVLMLSSFYAPGSFARTPSPTTHFYFIEYRRAPAGESITTLNAVFFIKVTGMQAESVLRSELALVQKLFPPKTDVLATAWFSPTADESDEKEILLPDGSNCLLYSAKDRVVLTWKEYDKRRHSP
jgi:hypothetical protein